MEGRWILTAVSWSRTIMLISFVMVLFAAFSTLEVEYLSYGS